MSENTAELLKYMGAVLAPVVLLWVKMYMTERSRAKADARKERIRLEEKKAAEALAMAQRLADEKKAVQIAEAVKEVAVKVDTNTTKTDEKLETIHTLVNSNMAQQLKISAVALRRVADLTKHADDVTAAKVAEDALAEHERKQKSVDAQLLKGST